MNGRARLFLAGAAILWATGAAGADALVERGRALVEANCSRCHALEPGQQSPHGEAPPFGTLSERYPLDALEEAFVEGISTGHPDMPEFTATPGQIEAIIAYIGTLQEQ